MSKKSVLESMRVTSPCTEDWDEMTGNAKVRFCSHCAKDVNNISEMTPKEAVRLARKSNGNLCIRYKYDPVTKAPLFGGRLHQLTRSPIAASGVMAASLALSTVAYAQGGAAPTAAQPEPVKEFVIDSEELAALTGGTFGSIAGTISDPQGAVIPNVTIKLLNDKGEQVRLTTTDSEGSYAIVDLLPGSYTIKAEAAFGFDASPDNTVSISVGDVTNWTTTLQLPQVAEQVEITTNERTYISGGAIAISVAYANPLTNAVATEEVDEVRKLIMNGADVNAREEDKTTPLFVAVENGEIPMVELLLNFGAKVNSRNIDKQTPLMKIDYEASPELVGLMVRYGVKINLTDNDGNTALIHAAENRVPVEVIRAMIDAGADVHLTNKEGRSALMFAAENDDVESVRTLLLAGAGVNIKDKEGETAWDHASDILVIELLESYGAVSGDPSE